MSELDAELWLDGRRGAELSAQVLHQQGGHAIILLQFEPR